MKTLVLALALSLLANLVLWRKPAASPAAAAAKSASSSSLSPRRAPGTTGTERGSRAEGEALARALAVDADPAALRDALRAIGLREDLVVKLVRARLDERAQRREAEFLATVPARPWWKRPLDAGWIEHLTMEESARFEALRRQAEDEADRVLGPESDDALADGFSYLAPHKRRAVERLEDDYYRIRDAITRETRFLALPEDEQKLRLLDAEREKDLAALLDPRELAEHRLRADQGLASRLVWELQAMRPTEAELRGLATIWDDFEQRHRLRDAWGNEVDLPLTPEQQAARDADEQAARERTKTLLGPERWKDYVRAQDWNYRQLQAAATRFGKDPAVATKIYDLRDELPRRATRIADAPARSPAQKRADLARLAAESRAQLKTWLGDAAYEAVNSRDPFYWVDGLEEGVIRSFDERGEVTRREVPAP